ncbi:Glycosyltransferase involved in cell wall bisynthesis [Pedobacter sp. ok626]|uniref:glycosyltransferase family 4 protein n=1 Tax=Pedobacter sp. ok626 TaxID=1761882 RepID=UPI000884F8B1|nr:glycosyltransferase family 4 protein [Pedobacter sp. ok626]SDJ60015.1 Glycosyltransferase involved in cell wall bisynthesis [Pedobacter sp. ok626]
MATPTRKLFFIINTLNAGGAERVISNLCNYFNSRNFDVSIVCLNQSEPAYYLAPEIKVYTLVDTERKSNFLFRIWYSGVTFFKLLNLLMSHRPKMMISFMTTANLWAGIACNVLGIPYIVSERTSPDDTVNKFNYLFRWLSYQIYNKAQMIVVPSKGMIPCFRKNKSFRKLQNFEVINNPINQFKPSVATGVHKRKFILAVGRLDELKGFDLLITAFKSVQRKDVDLLISGEGPDRKKLEDQILDLDLEHRVKLIGFKSNLQDYYKQAQLFVLSSRLEGYPNVLVEAMSLGCACVAADCEFGPADIIEHEKNGLLVKANSPIHLAEAMNRALEDTVLKAKMASNARLIIHANSTENTSEKWEKLVLQSI